MPQITPQFVNPAAKARVQQLMQPALIRAIDNIRKQLDSSAWQGRYEEELIWPKGTTSEQQAAYATLQKQLHGVPPEEHDRVAALMSELPQPSPVYTLRLEKAGSEDRTVNIWALCYQICSVAYDPDGEAVQCVEADLSLFDEDGEVDWRSLDEKTKALVVEIFEHLPSG